jgi:tRNA-dihydrouridine synthase
MAMSIVDEEVIAAGGVRNLEDIDALMKLSSGDQRLAGVIVGREVTAGRFTVEEAVERLEGGVRVPGPWSMEQLETALAEYRQVATDMGDDADAAVARVDAFLRWLGGGPVS